MFLWTFPAQPQLFDAKPADAALVASASLTAQRIKLTGIFFRPEADVSNTGWTDQAGGSSNLYAAVDEQNFDDADYIRSPGNPSGQACRLALPDLTPTAEGNVRVRYRAKKQGSAATLTVKLFEGSTERASWNRALTNSWVTYEEVLSSGEQASITNWADVAIQLSAA